MPRPRNNTPRTLISVRLPTDLVAKLTLKCADSRGRTKYGAIQKYFEVLLRKELQNEGESANGTN